MDTIRQRKLQLFGHLQNARRPTAISHWCVRDGGRENTTRTTCTKMDRRHSDVVWSRRPKSNVNDREQRQLEIYGQPHGPCWPREWRRSRRRRCCWRGDWRKTPDHCRNPKPIRFTDHGRMHTCITEIEDTCSCSLSTAWRYHRTAKSSTAISVEWCHMRSIVDCVARNDRWNVKLSVIILITVQYTMLVACRFLFMRTA